MKRDYVDDSELEWRSLVVSNNKNIDVGFECFGVYGETCRAQVLLKLPVERIRHYADRPWAKAVSIRHLPGIFPKDAGENEIEQIIKIKATKIGKTIKSLYREQSIVDCIKKLDIKQNSIFCSYFRPLKDDGVPIEKVYNAHFVYSEKEQDLPDSIRNGFFEKAHGIAKGVLYALKKERYDVKQAPIVLDSRFMQNRSYNVVGEAVLVGFSVSGELKRAIELL